jgi:predicted transcriptional regulator
MRAFTIRLPEDVADRLDDWAAAEFRTVSSLVTEILALAVGATIPQAERESLVTKNAGGTARSVSTRRVGRKASE